MKACRKTRTYRREAGYVMLAILLFATAMAIAALSVGRLYVGQIKRDREVELVHRGAQYARAIKKFYFKFHRYPSNLDQLENTNQIRFLRRRYKDPTTGQDFKLLHFGEVQLQPKSPNAATNPGIPAANLAGQTAAGGTTPTSPFTTAGGAPVAGGSVGGAPIIGVESTSKKVSLLEFNNKNHYNEWEFIYDPSLDPGGKVLIRGPYNGQTPVAGIAGQPGQPIVPGAPGTVQTQGGPVPQTPMNPMTPVPSPR